ncbi:sensor histidine kinase [Roseospira navarrensis]|uniref:histidine kinase n=1 Tax=Roseospira navarrensis TaxID=140058 RepID=A0A7X1ZFZ2_9PROT|nr:histidine kinase dimerization/phospho-acceptor domain-containing protein [Roseospira navarrensis]MQX37309.1 hypothetical protein [Roseospira navarrensis]
MARSVVPSIAHGRFRRIRCAVSGGVTSALALGLVLVLLVAIGGGDALANEKTRDLDTGWEYRWGDSAFNGKGTPVWAFEDAAGSWHDIRFPSNPPGREGRSNVWYRITLPDGEWRDPVLYVFSIDLIAEFYLEGRLIYRHGQFDGEGQGTFEGWPWHMIDLPPDFGGKRLSVRVWSDSYDIGLWGEVKVMERLDLLRHVADGAMVPVVVSALSLVLAIVAGALALVQPLMARIHGLIGIFTLLAGVMVLAQSQASQFLIHDAMVSSQIGAAAYFLLPVPMALLLHGMCWGRAVQVVDWVWRGHLAYAVGAIGASVAGLAALSDLYPVFDGLLTVSLIILVLAGARWIAEADRVEQVTFAGFVVFGGFLMIDMGVAHGVLPWTRMPLALGLLAFSAMLIGLSLVTFARTHRALRHLTVTLDQKVRDRTRDLEHSNAELQQFASVISHDLQAPLRLISGNLSLLSRRYGATLTEEGRAEIAEAKAAARRMAGMIQGVLDYARIESQGAAFDRVETGAVLQDALADLSADRERVGTTIKADPLPPLRGDRTQIRRLFQNLVGNALKYRREGAPPHVRISARPSDRDGWVVLSVADNGRGISPEDWPDALSSCCGGCRRPAMARCQGRRARAWDCRSASGSPSATGAPCGWNPPPAAA